MQRCCLSPEDIANVGEDSSTTSIKRVLPSVYILKELIDEYMSRVTQHVHRCTRTRTATYPQFFLKTKSSQDTL